MTAIVAHKNQRKVDLHTKQQEVVYHRVGTLIVVVCINKNDLIVYNILTTFKNYENS